MGWLGPGCFLAYSVRDAAQKVGETKRPIAVSRLFERVGKIESAQLNQYLRKAVMLKGGNRGRTFFG
jgi:hypothetical protein